MTLDEFQEATARTAGADDVAVLALGLCGEAGEFADLVKKALGHGHVFDSSRAAQELGDVLWYVARNAARMGMTLESIAQLNVSKLERRYPDGFTTEASISRVDVVK